MFWDECTLVHKAGIEALDQLLQMGGVTIVLAADFYPTLPATLKSVLKKYIWEYVKLLHLKTNKQVHFTGIHSAKKFDSNLLKLGNGKIKLKDSMNFFNENLGLNSYIIYITSCKLCSLISLNIIEITDDCVKSNVSTKTWMTQFRLWINICFCWCFPDNLYNIL